MLQNKPPKKGILRFTHTLFYSLSGLKYAWKHEESFRQEVIIFLISIPLTFKVGKNIYEYALLLGSVFLLLIIELVNSAIEATVDRISSETHELSKRAKDIRSAAVMLTIILCLALWFSVFVKNYIKIRFF